MSIFTRIHCDGCHHEEPWYEHVDRRRHPAGWFYLEWHDESDADDIHADDIHACSWRCLVSAIDRRRPVDVDRVPLRVSVVRDDTNPIDGDADVTPIRRQFSNLITAEDVQ